MRNSIDIDDTLMRQALRATGLPTKKAVVEEALRLLVRLYRQKAVMALAGKVAWQLELDSPRPKSRA